MPELPPIEQRLVAILVRAAEFSRPCKACHARIYFIRHNAEHGGTVTPYDEHGMNHFATCPQAAQFRKKAKAAGGAA